MDSLKRFEPLPEVECDAGLLRLVICDFLSPAVMAAGTGDSGGTRVCLVPDNGVGFDSKYADTVSGVPQRLPRQKQFEGRGIRLTTDKSSISIEARSAPSPNFRALDILFHPGSPGPGPQSQTKRERWTISGSDAIEILLTEDNPSGGEQEPVSLSESDDVARQPGTWLLVNSKPAAATFLAP